MGSKLNYIPVYKAHFERRNSPFRQLAKKGSRHNPVDPEGREYEVD